MAFWSEGNRMDAMARSGAIMLRSCTSPGEIAKLIRRPSVSTAVCRFLPLIFLPASYPAESTFAPLFRAFHGLAMDDCQGRCWVLALQFAHCGIECMMDPCKHTAAMQLDKIVMRRAFGRKVLGQLSPLAPGGKYVEYAVDE